MWASLIELLRQDRTSQGVLQGLEMPDEARVQLAALLRRAQPRWASHRGSRYRRLPDIFVETALQLEANVGLEVADTCKNVRDVARNLADAQLLAFILAYEFVLQSHATSPSLRFEVLPERFRDEVNAILDLHAYPCRLVGDGWDFVGSDAAPGELSQKFQILGSDAQLGRDFQEWTRLASAPHALLFFDIDHFKRLNTTHTETRVDSDLLIPFQTFLADFVTARGQMYSVGGDEFICLLRNVSMAEARAFAERLRSQVEKLTFKVGATTERVTLSIGAACYPEHAHDLASLRVLANQAENRAKRNGRNRVSITND